MAWTYEQKAFYKKTNKIIDAALYDTSIQVAKSLEKRYKNAVKVFYQSYTPKYYNRTESLLEASSMNLGQYAKNVKKLKNKFGYEVKLSVSSANVSDYTKDKHRADYDWIYERTMADGIHGFTPGENLEWASNPELRWTLKNTVPQKTRAPIHIFFKWFERFKRSGEIQKMFSKAFKDQIRKNTKR